MRLRFEYEQARVELPRLKVPFFCNFDQVVQWNPLNMWHLY